MTVIIDPETNPSETAPQEIVSGGTTPSGAQPEPLRRHAADLSADSGSNRGAVAFFALVLLLSAAIALLGKRYYGDLGSYVGAGFYIVVSVGGSIVMTVRELRSMATPSAPGTTDIA